MHKPVLIMKMQIPFSEVKVCEFFEFESTRRPPGFPLADGAFLRCQAMRIKLVFESVDDDSDGFGRSLRNVVVVKIIDDRPTMHFPKTEIGELWKCSDDLVVIVDRALPSGS